jgi:hypothetical protein
MNDGNIGLEYLPVEELRDVLKEDGDCVGSALGYGFANIGSHEERARPEYT